MIIWSNCQRLSTSPQNWHFTLTTFEIIHAEFGELLLGETMKLPSKIKILVWKNNTKTITGITTNMQITKILEKDKIKTELGKIIVKFHLMIQILIKIETSRVLIDKIISRIHKSIKMQAKIKTNLDQLRLFKENLG